MAEAVRNGTVIAESDDTIVVEGNHYFPADSVRRDSLVANPAHTVGSWKGTAGYDYDVVGDGQTNTGAAWYYPDLMPAAADIEDRVAFWRGVSISA